MYNSAYISEKFFAMMHAEDVSTAVRLHILKNITKSNVYTGTYGDIAISTGFSAISVKRALSSMRNLRDTKGNPFLVRMKKSTYMISPYMVVRADILEHEEQQIKEIWKELVKAEKLGEASKKAF